jgi:cobalamin-dependent methionine synthase I
MIQHASVNVSRQSLPRGGLAAGSRQRIEAVDSLVDVNEVWRYLGYPAGAEPAPAMRELLEATIAEAAASATPRAVYAIFPVAATTKRRLRVRRDSQEVEFQGAIGEFIGPVSQVAVFIATAGSAIGQRSHDLMAAGDYFGSIVFDAVGSERAEAAEAEVVKSLRAQLAAAKLELTLPYSPGYCGMSLTEQRKLFGLLGEETAGVELTAACLMQPIKSISGLMGIGPAEEVKAWGSPCDRCELWTCNMRR